MSDTNVKVQFKLMGREAITREVKETGNGAHVMIPREWRGENVTVIRTGK